MGIGFAGVALAFGLTVLTMAYAVGHVSGGHFNPAVTIGLATAKRFEWRDVPAYVVTQVVAGLVAGTASSSSLPARMASTASGPWRRMGTEPTPPAATR